MFKRSVALFILAIGASGASFGAEPEQTAGADAGAARRLQTYLDNLASFEARFLQRIAGAQSDGEESSGRFYLQRPGRLRWDYEQPHTQVIVTDGKSLWVYDKELQQVTVKALDAALAATPAMLLAGKESVLESFKISAGNAREGMEWIRMMPRRDDTDFLSVELGFSNGELCAMELRDKLGQTTRIEFSNVRRNAPLNAKLFQFKPPKGVDVIGSP